MGCNETCYLVIN